MMSICPVCGKMTAIHWPEHWVYRRGSTYYCSANCMETSQARDMKKINFVIRRRKGKGETNMANHKLTLEQKKKAVEIFNAGGDHIKYLTECGAKNPYATWAYITQKMPATAKAEKKEEPKGTLADAMCGMQEATDTFFNQCADMGLNVNAPETEQPSTMRFKVRGIEGDLGLFFYDKKRDCIDWTTQEGDEVSLSTNDWRKFLKQMPRIICTLLAEGIE